MSKLSKETNQIVQHLYDASRSKSWIGSAKREESIRTLLGQLAAEGEPEALPCAAHFLLAPNEGVRSSARNAVAGLLSNLSPYDLIHVTGHFASPYGWYVTEAWDKVKPSEVAAVAGKPSDKGHSAVLGLLTFHRNGFVRHKAVRHLSAIWDGTELPFLLVRQNDWVQPIAQDAQAAVEKRINDLYLPHLVKSLRLILHLNSFSRYDHSEIVRQTVDILLNEKHDHILRTAVGSTERDVRRKVIRHGLTKVGDHQARLISLGLRSDDPIVRLQSCRHLASVYESDGLLAVLDRLIADPFMPVRHEAARIKAERFPNVAIETWQKALLDPSRSIRGLARFFLTKLGQAEVAQFYRHVIAKHPDRFAALVGLSESADQTDLEFFRRLLQHPLPSRRCAAVRALSRVGKDTALDDILPCLRDDNPGVVREVRNAIIPYLFLVPANQLIVVALEAPGAFARRNAVDLLAELGKWRSIPWLLRAASDADEDTAGYAVQLIEQWFTPPKCNKVFTSPTERDTQDITATILDSKGKVPANLVAFLEREMVRFGHPK